MPIAMNPIEATIFKKYAGIIVEIDPPAKAPNRLARTSAKDEPTKTATGLLLLPLMATVANWVLSPNSATKTVENVDNSKGISIIYKVGEFWINVSVT